MSAVDAPTVILLISTHCPHCPSMLQSLSELVKNGEIAQLQVINLEKSPQAAQQFGVRSVPWVKIEPFKLLGLRTQQELRDWIQKAKQAEGIDDYFNELLAEGQAAEVIAHIRNQPNTMQAILHLLGNPKTILSSRIGIGVVMEELVTEPFFEASINTLIALTKHNDARIRADACHYLSLTGNERIISIIKKMTKDPDTEVQEVARDSLENMRIL